MSGQKVSDPVAMRMAHPIAKGSLRGEAVAHYLLSATLQKASKVQRGFVSPNQKSESNPYHHTVKPR